MDKKFLQWLIKIRNERLNKIMVFITHLGTGAFIWILTSFILYIIGQRTLACNVIFALIINGIICNLILKPLLKRKRPSWIEKVELLIKNPTDFSFPSGHAASSFAAAITIFLYFKTLGILFLCLATLIGFSRIYHFVHYPSDVIVGAILGTVIGHMSFWIFWKYVINYLASKNFLAIM